MYLARETTFWCGDCGKNIVAKVYRDNINPLPEEEKARALDLIMLYHQIEIYTLCWKCGKRIRSHEITGMNWIHNVLENLCGDCV